MITFTVPSVPVAQPRQRSALIAGTIRNYTPAAHPVNAFKAAVQKAATDAYRGPPLVGPLSVMIEAVFPRPKSKTRKRGPNAREPKTAKPDCDNVAKACLDCLSRVIFQDDAQVTRLYVVKCIASADEQPHVTIEIQELGEQVVEPC